MLPALIIPRITLSCDDPADHEVFTGWFKRGLLRFPSFTSSGKSARATRLRSERILVVEEERGI